MCDGDLEVINDGRKRRCRWKESEELLEWSGRVRYCRTQLDNARILIEEATGNTCLLFKIFINISHSELQYELERHADHIPLIQARSGPSNGLLSSHVLEKSVDDDNEKESELLNPFLDLLENDQQTPLKTILQNGETYFNGFDFVQRVQRWMYNLGLYNLNPFR